MSLQNRLKKIKDALTAVDGLKVYHYWRSNLKAPFCIWAEDGENRALESDGEKAEQDAIVYVDYFTAKEFDPMLDDIQAALNTTGNYWKWTQTLYEDDTKLIHYTWEMWVTGDGKV